MNEFTTGQLSSAAGASPHLWPTDGCDCFGCVAARNLAEMTAAIEPAPSYRIGAPTPAPSCSRCRWFVQTRSECHRHAPAPNGRPGDVRTRIFPVVSPEESCGDFKVTTCQP